MQCSRNAYTLRGIMEKYFDIVRGRNVINLLNRSIKIRPSCLICMPTSKMFINGPKTGCDPSCAHRNFHSPLPRAQRFYYDIFFFVC